MSGEPSTAVESAVTRAACWVLWGGGKLRAVEEAGKGRWLEFECSGCELLG